MGSLPAQGAFLFLHSFLSLQGCVVADEDREVVVLGLRPVLDGCGDGVGSLLGGEVLVSMRARLSRVGPNSVWDGSAELPASRLFASRMPSV